MASSEYSNGLPPSSRLNGSGIHSNTSDMSRVLQGRINGDSNSDRDWFTTFGRENGNLSTEIAIPTVRPHYYARSSTSGKEARVSTHLLLLQSQLLTPHITASLSIDNARWLSLGSSWRMAMYDNILLESTLLIVLHLRGGYVFLLARRLPWRSSLPTPSTM